MQEIIKELMAQKNTQEIDSEQEIMRTHRVKAQRPNKKAWDNIEGMKDFDHIQRSRETKVEDNSDPKLRKKSAE